MAFCFWVVRPSVRACARVDACCDGLPSTFSLHLWRQSVDTSCWLGHFCHDKVAVDSWIRPPACKYRSVHWLPASPRPLYVEAVPEDGHTPGRGTLVMMIMISLLARYLSSILLTVDVVTLPARWQARFVSWKLSWRRNVPYCRWMSSSVGNASCVGWDTRPPPTLLN